MNVMGFKMDAEPAVSKGRIDAVLELDDKVFVMEFKYVYCPPGAGDEDRQKLSGAALEDGMSQIKGRGYKKKTRAAVKQFT